MLPVALGLRAGRVVVGVAADRPLAPRVVVSAFLATAADGDRLAFEPYQVAYEMPRAEGGGPTADAAAAGAGLDVVEMDEKSLRESAALELPLTPGQIDFRLNALGATAGRPWRKEQKMACLAAWVAAAGF